MSNQDRAAQVIADKILVSLFNKSSHSPQSLGDDIADTLDDMGLLTPDLPEPSNIIEEDEEGGDKRICWYPPGCGVELVPGEMIVTYEHQAGHEIENAHQIALALLAAANYQEEACPR